MSGVLRRTATGTVLHIAVAGSPSTALCSATLTRVASPKDPGAVWCANCDRIDKAEVAEDEATIFSGQTRIAVSDLDDTDVGALVAALRAPVSPDEVEETRRWIARAPRRATRPVTTASAVGWGGAAWQSPVRAPREPEVTVGRRPATSKTARAVERRPEVEPKTDLLYPVTVTEVGGLRGVSGNGVSVSEYVLRHPDHYRLSVVGSQGGVPARFAVEVTLVDRQGEFLDPVCMCTPSVRCNEPRCTMAREQAAARI